MHYYHVASRDYTKGEPLLCWDRLAELGAVTEADWRWADADPGFDGDVVCLFETMGEAQEFAAEHGGIILAVDVPDDQQQYIVRVEEGYPAMPGEVPAEWITRI